ncbi:hypothetical protein [Alkalimarinus coralli]|uniref:hypothetical protein n=1 Tax=Alkalimarinus coralli TaxID=2935863 RepID=UPI00202B6DA7|nr:hypothetical protein [Alkalimarinus coralli]
MNKGKDDKGRDFMRLTGLSIGVVVLAVSACANQHYEVQQAPAPVDVEEIKNVPPACDLNLPAEDWVGAFMLPDALREEAISTVEETDSTQNMWLRAVLLTHTESSYRDLREAESQLLKLMQLTNAEPTGCDSNELLEYVLKINQMLQEHKSEVVLLQRKINQQNKSIKSLEEESAVLKKKIEALTNIEQRMKQRSKSVKAEAAP